MLFSQFAISTLFLSILICTVRTIIRGKYEFTILQYKIPEERDAKMGLSFEFGFRHGNDRTNNFTIIISSSDVNAAFDGKKNILKFGSVSGFTMNFSSANGPLECRIQVRETNFTELGSLIETLTAEVEDPPLNEYKMISVKKSTGLRKTRSDRSAYLQMMMQVDCYQSYYQISCSVHCIPTNDSSGHYTCDKDGKKVCMEGWTGHDCRDYGVTLMFFSVPRQSHVPDCQSRGHGFYDIQFLKQASYEVSWSDQHCESTNACKYDLTVTFRHGSDVLMNFTSKSLVGNSINLGSRLAHMTWNPFNVTWSSIKGLFYYYIAVKAHGGRRDKGMSFSGSVSISPMNKWITVKGKKNSNTYFVFRVRAQCHRFFYGSSCSRCCLPRNDSQGHHICNLYGDKVCMSGWSGRNCEVRKTPPINHEDLVFTILLLFFILLIISFFFWCIFFMIKNYRSNQEWKRTIFEILFKLSKRASVSGNQKGSEENDRK